MEVGANSLAEGQGLRALMQRCDDVHILGLRRDSGLERWHEAGDELRAGDVLAVMGSAATLGRLTSLVRRDSRE